MHPYVHSSTKTKTWEEPKCPLTDEWIKKMWCLSNEILLSHKKEQNITTCSNMDTTRDSILRLNEVRKRKTNTV